MHLKQLRWNTVPSARTNGPCNCFPQAEQELEINEIRFRIFTESTYVEVRDVDVVETVVGGGFGFEYDDEAEELEATLERLLNPSECPELDCLVGEGDVGLLHLCVELLGGDPKEPAERLWLRSSLRAWGTLSYGSRL